MLNLNYLLLSFCTHTHKSKVLKGCILAESGANSQGLNIKKIQRGAGTKQRATAPQIRALGEAMIMFTMLTYNNPAFILKDYVPDTQNDQEYIS